MPAPFTWLMYLVVFVIAVVVILWLLRMLGAIV
jgi:hypothetical protein